MSTIQYLYTQRKDNTNEVTVAPNITDLDVTNSYEYLTNDTTLRQALPSDIISDSEIQAAIDFRNAFKQGDVITALNVFLANANSIYFKQADFSLENILYWYQKLKLSNKEIISYQSQVSFYGENILSNQLAGGSLFTRNTYNSGSFNQNNYFDNISDSIGLIVNSKYIQLDSTLPLFDINQQYYGVPIPYSASIESKMSATARNVAFDLSQKTTMLMRRNLIGIGYTNPTLQQNMNADASTSHGLNLINDLPTFVTINESLGMLKDKLSSVFAEAKVFGFVQYMCNIANETAMNLRDIFPRTPGDRDFTVITSAENAQASQEIAQQEANEALAEQTLYAQQQGFDTPSITSNTSNNGYTTDTEIANNPSGPIVNTGYRGTIPGDTIDVKATAYSPQGAGSAIGKMEGGYGSAYTGPDGQKTVQTLQDYATGNSNYISIAGDPRLKNQTYVIPKITYIDPSGSTRTLYNVPAMVQDTGGAFKTAGTSRFDIPIYKNGTNAQMGKQPFTATPVTFTPVTKEAFNGIRSSGPQQSTTTVTSTTAPRPGAA